MSIGQEFIEDIMRDGEVKASRRHILELIKVRFGNTPVYLQAKIRATSDLPILDPWLRLMAQANDMKEKEKGNRP